jgi:hypothetical protein
MTIICVFSISGYGIYPGTALARKIRERSERRLWPYYKRWGCRTIAKQRIYECYSRISFLNSAVVPDRLAIAIEYGEDTMKLAW